jgi:hypothetical protein
MVVGPFEAAGLLLERIFFLFTAFEAILVSSAISEERLIASSFLYGFSSGYSDDF